MKKNNSNKKPTFELWEVILISLVSSLIMSLSTGYVVFRNKSDNDCSNVVDNENIAEFVKSYNNVLTNYYEKVDEHALIDAAISGMMSSLGDDYTTHLNESSTNMLTDSLSGTYEGIGVEVSSEENAPIEIKKVFASSPSEKAGIKVGDIITSINGTSVEGKTSTEAVNLIKGATDPNIGITVKRGEEELTFNITRTSLYVPAVSSKTFDKNGQKVGYIYVGKFSSTVYEQFNDELKKLEKDNINNLIIDVRNNTGGYLTGATKIAELFLEKGKVIYSLKNKLSTDDTKDTTDEKRSYKVFVITNGSSASASEVLTAALKYSYGSKLVGVTSFGKGKVQKTSTLTDGTMIKYTSAEWLTPNGDCIDKIGLKPDFEEVLSDDYANNPSDETDNQLQRALNEITK